MTHPSDPDGPARQGAYQSDLCISWCLLPCLAGLLLSILFFIGREITLKTSPHDRSHHHHLLHLLFFIFSSSSSLLHLLFFIFSSSSSLLHLLFLTASPMISRLRAQALMRALSLIRSSASAPRPSIPRAENRSRRGCVSRRQRPCPGPTLWRLRLSLQEMRYPMK
jgi:hypothetical protein